MPLNSAVGILVSLGFAAAWAAEQEARATVSGCVLRSEKGWARGACLRDFFDMTLTRTKERCEGNEKESLDAWCVCVGGVLGVGDY